MALIRIFALAALLIGCPDPVPPCEPKPVIRGPWAVGLYATEAEVRWETAEDGCGGLRFAPDDSTAWLGALASTATAFERTLEVGTGVLEQPDLPGTSYLHRVRIQNLQPNHCYTYEISQEVTSHKGRFCTAAQQVDETTTLALIGDTNPALGHTELLYEPIAAARPRAILHLGDIQYYESVIETWSAWHTRTQPLLATAPILPVVGNHEFEGVGAQAGQEQADQTEYREYFLPLWGGHGHPKLGNNFAVRIAQVLYIFADSESLDGTRIWDEKGALWLQKTLTEAEAKPEHAFSVLLFHRPVYTRSKYSAGVSRRDQLTNLLAGHRVPLVLAGHAHCYERFEVMGRTFVVSGGGGALPHRCDLPHDDSTIAAELESLQRVHRTAYHWVKLSQTSAGLAGQAIAEDGPVLDDWEVRP